MSLISEFDKEKIITVELENEVIRFLKKIYPNEEFVSVCEAGLIKKFSGISVHVMDEYIGCRRYEDGEIRGEGFRIMWDNLKDVEMKMKAD